MKPKLYTTLPEVGDFVMFTQTIIDELGRAGSPYFGRYRGHKLQVLNVERTPYLNHATIKFLSVPLNLEDIIGMESDGTIASPSCLEIQHTIVFQSWMLDGSEPKNNDGRMECFWCNVPTQKRGGGMYDVCPKCGR
jgi:hypothetical protein